MFTSPLFTGSASQHRRFEPGDRIVKDAKFWIPLIAFYSGMRLGEIVQLHLNDVVLGHETPHFDLNEESGTGDPKHIKTNAGVRLVPIHPDLIELGLEDLFKERKRWNREGRRVFSEVTLGSDGQASTQFSKFFARAMDRVGLIDPKLTFHSFRHGAEDAFRNAGVPQFTIDCIMGHSDGKVSTMYGEGPSLEMKADAVRAMELPLRLPEILEGMGDFSMSVQLNKHGAAKSFPITSPPKPYSLDNPEWIASEINFTDRLVSVSYPFPDMIGVVAPLSEHTQMFPDQSEKSAIEKAIQFDQEIRSHLKAFPATEEVILSKAWPPQAPRIATIHLKSAERHLAWIELERKEPEGIPSWRLKLQFNPRRLRYEGLVELADRFQDALFLVRLSGILREGRLYRLDVACDAIGVLPAELIVRVADVRERTTIQSC